MAREINAKALKEAIERSQNVQLKAINLLETTAHRRGVTPNKLPGLAEYTIKTKAQRRPNSKRFLVTIEISLDAKYREKDSEPVLQVAATYAIEYETSGRQRVTDADIKRVAETTAHLNVWPYWRELAQSTTTRMGLPPAPVPLLNLGSFSTKPEPRAKAKRKK